MKANEKLQTKYLFSFKRSFQLGNKTIRVINILNWTQVDTTHMP